MLPRTTLVRTITSNGAKRSMSDGPKMHKASAWQKLEATRPVDPHPHPVFEPPFNPVASGALVFGCVVAGYGVIYNGMRHQQYKQGYWK
mmetsp:Transcript_26703/g.37635  ORF Transcript_26703/g.37635 Transcript_26703/m.37635 type:complete len:89 (-) Transcript_26703:299-565(-)